MKGGSDGDETKGPKNEARDFATARFGNEDQSNRSSVKDFKKQPEFIQIRKRNQLVSSFESTRRPELVRMSSPSTIPAFN